MGNYAKNFKEILFYIFIFVAFLLIIPYKNIMAQGPDPDYLLKARQAIKDAIDAGAEGFPVELKLAKEWLSRAEEAYRKASSPIEKMAKKEQKHLEDARNYSLLSFVWAKNAEAKALKRRAEEEITITKEKIAEREKFLKLLEEKLAAIEAKKKAEEEKALAEKEKLEEKRRLEEERARAEKAKEIAMEFEKRKREELQKIETDRRRIEQEILERQKMLEQERIRAEREFEEKKKQLDAQKKIAEQEILERQRVAEEERVKIAREKEIIEKEKAFQEEAARIKGATTILSPEGLRIIIPRNLLVKGTKLQLLPSANEYLGEIGRLFRKYQEYKLKITAHSDSSGNEAFNLGFTMKLAELIKRYLIEKEEISEERIVSVNGVGSSKPLVEDIKSLLNRRVEIIVPSLTGK